MFELSPVPDTIPEGDELYAALDALACMRFIREPEIFSEGTLFVPAAVVRTACQGVIFEELDSVSQQQTLLGLGLHPLLAESACRLLPSVRAINAALEEGVSVEEIIAAMREHAGTTHE